MKKNTLLAFGLFFITLLSTASAEEMETDRPDFTEGTRTILPNNIQIESGYTFTRNTKNNSSEHTFPEFLARVGINELVELRLFWEGLSLTRLRAGDTTSHDDGILDSSLGTKIRLIENDNSFLLSTIIETTLPTGERNKSSDEFEPAIKLLWAYDLNKNTGIAGNLNANFAADDNGSLYFQPEASLAIETPLTETIASYLEYFAFFPVNQGIKSEHYLNGGFTYSVTDNLQFDIRLGLGLSKNSDDLFTGVGFALKL